MNERTTQTVDAMQVDYVDSRVLVPVEEGRAVRVALAAGAGSSLGSLVVAVRVYEDGQDRDFASAKAVDASAPVETIDADDMIGVTMLALNVTTAAASGTFARFTITSDPIT